MPRTGTSGILASIVFFGIGAVMYFAIADAISGVDLKMIGLIIMGLSALGFLVSLAGYFSARSETERATAGRVVEEPVVEERVRRTL